MRASLFVVVCALAGCAQLAGIDKTSGGGGDDDDGPDGGSGGSNTPSSMEFFRYSVGATIVQTPIPTSDQLAPTFFVGDTQLTGTSDGAATWSTTERADSVLFHLPDFPTSIPRIFQLPAPALQGLFGVLERPGAVPPPDAAVVNLAYNLPSPIVAGDGFEVLDVGAWSVIGIGVAVGDVAVTVPSVPYASWTSETGRPLDSIGVGDEVLGLHYTGNQLTSELDQPGFAQTGNDNVGGALTALPLDQTLNAAVFATSGATRLATAQPTSAGTPAVVWSLVAAPGYRIASGAGVQLNAANGTPTDATVAATYSNPFLAHLWNTMFVWVIHLDRTYTPTAGTLAGQAIGLTAQLETIREPGDGTAPDQATLDSGMPLVVTLGTTAMTTDGLALTEDVTQPLTVSFTADTTANTVYQVQVLESSLSGATQILTDDLAFTGTAPTMTLPANTLVAGHTYRLRVVCIEGGFPSIASGDFTNRTLPFSAGILDSAVFSVGAPD